MTPSETVLIALAALCVIAMLMQAFALLGVQGTVKTLSKRLGEQSKKLEGDVAELSSKIRQVTENLEPLGTISQDLSRNVNEVSAMVSRRSGEMDVLVEEVVKAGRDQAAKIDFVVTDTVQKFEQTTDIIQRDILRPAAEITAFIKGLRSGLQYLFSKAPTPAAPGDKRPDREEDLFI